MKDPDDNEFDTDTFDRSFTDWIDDMPDDGYLDHCFNYAAGVHFEDFTRHLKEIYRPIYDRLVESERSEYDPD